MEGKKGAVLQLTDNAVQGNMIFLIPSWVLVQNTLPCLDEYTVQQKI